MKRLNEEVDAEYAQAHATKDPDHYTKIFDKLKPKQTIWLSYSAVMGSQDKGYRPYTVGRRTTSKKYKVQSVSLLRSGQKSASSLVKLTLMKRSNGSVQLAIGDMAANIHGMYLEGESTPVESVDPRLTMRAMARLYRLYG